MHAFHWGRGTGNSCNNVRIRVSKVSVITFKVVNLPVLDYKWYLTNMKFKHKHVLHILTICICNYHIM